MSATWVYKTNNRIFALIQYRAKKILETDYPNILFTREEEASGNQNIFPCVYIKFMSGRETAESLKGTSINAYQCDIQLQVTANKTQGIVGAETVIWECVEAAKKLGFTMTVSPVAQSTGNDTRQFVCRMRRLIGYNDIIN